MIHYLKFRKGSDSNSKWQKPENFKFLLAALGYIPLQAESELPAASMKITSLSGEEEPGGAADKKLQRFQTLLNFWFHS